MQRGFPLEAINYALEEALDDATVPSGAVGKIANTPVKAIAGVQFGEEPQPRPLPEKAELRFDALIVKLAKATGKRILLISGETVTISKVRAALDRLRKAGVLAKCEGMYMIEDKLFADHISRTNTLKKNATAPKSSH